jgi:hypothetical protein
MDQKRGTGSLACRLCGASFQMPIHHLHEPIDVFSEWLDECEAVARQSSGGGDMGGGGGNRVRGRRRARCGRVRGRVGRRSRSSRLKRPAHGGAWRGQERGARDYCIFDLLRGGA